MMDFPSTVNVYPAIGVPGAFASVNPVVSTPLGRIASENIKIGGFCFDDADNEGCVVAAGETVLGFVARDVMYPIYDLTADDFNIVPKGGNVNVQLNGDFYVAVTAAVTKGQKVFASTTDGSVSGADAGETVEGSVETDWVFATSADADGIALISNH